MLRNQMGFCINILKIMYKTKGSELTNEAVE